MRLAKDYGYSQLKKEPKHRTSVHIRKDNGVKIPLTKERSRYHDDPQNGDEDLIIKRLRLKYSIVVENDIDKIIDKILSLGWSITTLQMGIGNQSFYVKITKDDCGTVDRKAVRLKLAFLLVLQAITRDWSE